MTPKALKTLEGALEFIRTIEPRIKDEAHCFLGLCGGVLRTGKSEKDLDLILIPMNGSVRPDTFKALAILEEQLGAPSVANFGSDGAPRQDFQPLTFYLFRQRGFQVDVIVVTSIY